MHIYKVGEIATDATQIEPLLSHSSNVYQEERPVSHGAHSQQSRALSTLLGYKIDSENVWSKGHHAHLGILMVAYSQEDPTMSLKRWIVRDTVGFQSGIVLGSQFKNGNNASSMPFVFFSSSDSASPMVSNCSGLMLASAHEYTTLGQSSFLTLDSALQQCQALISLSKQLSNLLLGTCILSYQPRQYDIDSL